MRTALTPLHLAIADPPYLGRADRWYGDGRGSGRTNAGTGRNGRKPDHHTHAARWDDIATHHDLIRTMEANFDGWALAAAADRVHELMAVAPRQAHLCVWVRPNAMPGGGRVINKWEPVIVRVHDTRRNRRAGMQVSDVLVAPTHRSGFLGSKPEAWTRWVLNLLGATAEDDVTDLFPGSGSVTEAVRFAMQSNSLLDGGDSA